MEAGTTASLSAPVLAGIVSFSATLVLFKNRSLPLDKPNERSLHAVPVPRTGGMAIMGGILAAALLLRAAPAIVVPAVVLAVISYFDDRHALPVSVRLATHLLAAAVFLWGSGMAPGIAMIVLVLAIGWLTNLYNFMDGSDGLAGGMAVIGFGAYGVAAAMGDAQPLALLSWSIAAAACGFLAFNFPPARIFMGDVGSIALGFLAGAIGVAGWCESAWPLWFPLAVFAPFIVDASVTLVRRALRSEQIWQAHRSHYYQRLILSGWSHRRTALWEYALMLTCAAFALVARDASAKLVAGTIAALVAVVLAAMWAVDRRWKHFEASTSA
jgi:UDP-N-acetylmuramyl pentapeptide phosphotransferase/UDP-N-acetylglucosamine-1-phosphate transferase